ncbi:MAG: nuclear transport factor 2 family protein [Sphingomicrobium sp.]
MPTDTNKRLVRTAFEALGQADMRPFYDLMSDDFAWIIEGQSRFSRSYEGKEAVKRDLLAPLFEAFATPYRFTIDEIIAEADRVVVRGRGEVRTKAGKDYNNSYCFVLRLEGGKLVELREYLDTALVERVFGAAG